MSIRNIILVLALFLIQPVWMMAQDLPDEEVTVLKNFEATLAESERTQVLPELPDLDTSKALQTYTLPNKFLQVDYPAPKIRPLAMRARGVQDAHNGYLKLGAGIPTTFLGEAGYHVFAQDQFDFGIDLRHHSANFRNVEHQRFMNNDIRGTGTYYFDEGFAANAHLGFNSNDVHYYAFNFQDELKDSIVQKADVLQRFNTFSAGASLFNGERNIGDINYNVGFDLYTLGDNYGSNERGFDLELEGTKWINGDHALNVLISTDFTRFEDTTVQNLNNFFLQPSFTYHGDIFKAKAGINLASHNDEFILFPDLEVSVNIIGSQLAAFAGWNGDLVKNNLQSLSNYNPFINTRIQLANSNVQHYYGGVKGDIKILQYSAQFGIKQVDNLAIFLPEANPESVIRRRFDVAYDTATIVNLEATLTVQPFKGLDIIGTFNNNIYDLTLSDEPYGLPGYTITAAALYTTLEDKLRFQAQLFMENGIPYITDAGTTDKLNGLFDISFGADYNFSENFGVFLNVNNLADNKRQRWPDYPTFGINVLGGINVRF